MNKRELNAALLDMAHKKRFWVEVELPPGPRTYYRKLYDTKMHIRKFLAQHGVDKSQYDFSTPDFMEDKTVFVVGYD